ncbi:hypothetical protein [Noviherbaspirillum aridicola]|uniref:Uncharacterized protein n=1 Tax=Noviherbaspirillum aridicola TaxID=2849687 RepID=A0ABQ4Q965_9BURK|nr:hypothetical protein [Noviherbaspirillum aridicola]GIZ53591.1 hypothetical protein NCCP691_36050 [Noviherbaspirillum aridicola]
MLNSQDQTPRSRLSALIVHVWRLAMPLWMFRDAHRGTVEQRIANYRYNRAQRKVLPFYVWKWVGIAFCLLQITRVLSAPLPDAASGAVSVSVLIFCTGAGIGFALSCVVIAVLGASYLYLSCVER